MKTPKQLNLNLGKNFFTFYFDYEMFHSAAEAVGWVMPEMLKFLLFEKIIFLF